MHLGLKRVFLAMPRKTPGSAMREFLPRLEVLRAPRRQLWPELVAVPAEFALYGGTAVALHLGHRHSVDFDFFGSRALDLSLLESRIPFLAVASLLDLAGTKASVLQVRAEANMDYGLE